MRNRNGIFGSFAGLACAIASLALLATGCSDASSDYPLQVTILASATDGTVPMTVEFQAVAVGGDAPYEYSWNFADGSEASSEPNPIHTFDAVGRYDVIVVVNDGGGNEVTRTLAIEVHPTLSVQVAVDPTGGVAPLQVAASATVTGGMPPYRYEWDFGDGNGSNRQVATNVYQTGGTFTVNLTVRDALDQAADAQATVTVRDDHVPIATIRALPTVGIAPLTVAFAGTAVGGDAPMTWEWHFGDGDKATTQDADHEYEDAGRYSAVLVVTDADGDQGTAQVEIVVGTDAVPAVQATATPASGVAPLTVRLEAQAAGGNAPLAYAWDFDDDGKTDATLPAPVHVFPSGTHDVTVTVTDADGDEAEATVTVTVQADTTPVVTAEATPEAGRAPLSVAFTCTATGINLPYAYQWDFGDGATSVLANPAHTYAQGGDYTATCTVVDADGDIASGTVAVAVAANRVPRIAITANPLVGVVPFDVSFQAAGDGGDAPVNYLWTFGNGNSSTAANPTHRYTAPGTFTVVLSATDADGDSAVAQVQVTATADGTPAVEIAAQPTTGIAPLRVAFQANVAGGNAPVQYDWSFGDGTKSVVANPVKTFPAGSHTVSVTVRDADGDTDTETVTIVASTDTGPDATAQAAPAAGLAPLAVAFTCAATGGNPPLSYHWDFGDGTSSPLANPSRTYAQAGTYIASCAVTDADGDTDVSATTVNVAADRQPQVVAVATPAAGVAPMEVAFQATVLGGDGPFAYAWTFGDGAASDQAAPVHVYETPGTYDALVVVTDADGDQATAFVTVDMTTDDVPVVEIAGGPLAGIEPLVVRFQAAVAGGNGTLRYEWDFDIPVDGTATVPAPVRTFAAGTYDVVLTVTDEDGDTATDTVQVVVDADTVPSPGASAVPMEGLAPLTVAFRCGADGGNPPLAYRWEFGDGATSSLANPSYTYPRAGAYQAICTVTDADGDAASDAVSVAVHEDTAPRVQVRATPTAGLAPLEVRFASSVVGGNPPLQYAWDFGDDSLLSGVPDPMHVYAPGTFTARLTVTDADGDQDVADVAISVGDASQPAAEIAIDPTAGAAPLLVRFHCEAVGGNPPYAYRWTFGDGASADTPDAEHLYTIPGGFEPRCTVTDAFGQTGSQSWFVDVAPSNAVPIIDVLFLDNGWPDTAPECAAAGQTQMLLKVVAGDADGDPLSYEWRFDEVPPGSTAWFNNPGVMNPTFVPDLPGTYVARVFVRDGRGGQASDTLVVNAEIPNGVVAVSPEPPLAGVADETFPEPLVARVETACGVPFAGIPVHWSAFNGSLMAASGVSDDAGRVTATVRLGCVAGDHAEFGVAADGLSWDAHFGIAVGPNAPAALLVEAQQDVPVVDADGNPVPMAVSVRLVDRCGNAVVDADVTFDLHVQPSPPTCLGAPCSQGGVGELAGLQTVGGVWTGNAYGTVAGEVTFWADNLSDPSIVTGGWRVGQSFDFEADGGGFMLGAENSYPDEWEWGEPTVPVAAHSGNRAWDTRLDDDYRPSLGDWPEHRFLFRGFDLPCTGGMPIELRFWEYHDIGDHALARVAADCPQCTQLLPLDAETAYDATLDGFSGYQGIAGGWREVRMDLTPWQCGGVTVFWDLYLNQAGMTRAGWTIDDVSIRHFSPQVTGRFVAGPPHYGILTTVNAGVVDCPSANGSVFVEVVDRLGNLVAGADVRVDFAGAGTILLTGVDQGDLLSQDVGTAVIRMQGSKPRVYFSDTVAETISVTLPDLQDPWGGGGVPAGGVTFGPAAAEVPGSGVCLDGYDNDCDGDADCQDADCAVDAECLPDLTFWRHTWDDAQGIYTFGFCNEGWLPAPGPFEIAVHAVPTGGPMPGVSSLSWLTVKEYAANLPSFACDTLEQRLELPFGTWDLYYAIDWDNRVLEGREANNVGIPGAPVPVVVPFGSWESAANGNCLDGIDNEPDLSTDCESMAGAPPCKTDAVCQNIGSPLDPFCDGVDDTSLGVPDLAACRCRNDSGCDAIGPGYRCYDEMNQFGPDQAFCAPPCGDMFWWTVFPGMPSYDIVCQMLTGGMMNFCDKYAGRCGNY